MHALVIGCSDGGVALHQSAFINDLDTPAPDRLIVPGGPLPFTRPGAERRVALGCVRDLVEAHDVRVIHLLAHQECTAYSRALGGLGFDQRELLVRDLHRVKSLLETTFAGVDVRCWVIPWHENGGGAGYGPAEPVD
jgi:hypothetical protein